MKCALCGHHIDVPLTCPLKPASIVLHEVRDGVVLCWRIDDEFGDVGGLVGETKPTPSSVYSELRKYKRAPTEEHLDNLWVVAAGLAFLQLAETLGAESLYYGASRAWGFSSVAKASKARKAVIQRAQVIVAELNAQYAAEHPTAG